MEILLGAILSYAIGLAANATTSAVQKRREKQLAKQFENEEALHKALASTRPLREELRAACVELARNHDILGVTRQEEPLWRLLSDDVFQEDLVEWLMAGAIVEGNAVKERLLARMEAVLADGGAAAEQISFLKKGFFDALDKAVFEHQALAHWRHQLSLDYLREQVAVLRQRAEEAAGTYSPKKQKAALDRYCEKGLKAWDIIDLSNLPEGDVHSATQTLLLRQLYMPLRIEIEETRREMSADAVLAGLEERREARRQHYAGLRNAADESRLDVQKPRFSVGERLGASGRIVVLGDPGGGKTTMLRWMATAFLLKHRGDEAFQHIPDIDTLPDQPWIPVLIRCRDLGDADLCRCFTDFLAMHLKKTELLPEDADVMRAVILNRIAEGKALLLVDGLDEITNPDVRVKFCKELECTAARYPASPIVITSRVVGYRDMPYRMGSCFEHGLISELSREDKDSFAKRWVDVTEPHRTEAEKEQRVKGLREALHSNDRIDRLTGNPMLLTTLALVKRKVGKLPNRRSKLYAEAVSVLLNWNYTIFETIEEDEAIPQLEYLAYEMCRRGVQRLTEGEVLDLLDRVRREYPNIRAIANRKPKEFLRLLEARSSILIKSGKLWQMAKAQEKEVWEFRHLTFQEYLAARALLDGRYPGRDKSKSLADQISPLAGAVEKGSPRQGRGIREEETEVPESWREALRLLVADSKDDDVDDVLLAILNPSPGEDAAKTMRPRIVLATLCLSDEPNISENTAKSVLAEFAGAILERDGNGHIRTSIASAGVEVGASVWATLLRQELIREYCRRPEGMRSYPGSLWGGIEVSGWQRAALEPTAAFNALSERLMSSDRTEVLSAALTAMEAAFQGKAVLVPGLIERLIALLKKGGVESHAAAWAFMWLSNSTRLQTGGPLWKPDDTELQCLVDALNSVPAEEHDLKRFLMYTLGNSPSPLSTDAVISMLGDPGKHVRVVAINTLGKIRDKRAAQPLVDKLGDPDKEVRVAVVEALGQLGDKHSTRPLMAKLDDPDGGVCRAAVKSLGQLGDKQAVPSLLAKLDDPDERLRLTTIKALGQLADQRAVPPLLAKLNGPVVDERKAIIRLLGQLGDKQATQPLIARLDDPVAAIRRAAVEALGHLGDKSAIERLIPKLHDADDNVCAATAAALGVLDADRWNGLLSAFLDHKAQRRRQAAVREIASARGVDTELSLLSRGFDSADPWIDPRTPITEARVVSAAEELRISPCEARSLYESIATVYHLRFE